MPILTVRAAQADFVSPNVLHLSIERPEGVNWKTGEFAMIGLTVNDGPLMRCYSIASPGNAPTLEFYITIVQGGALTPLLAKLKAGDTLLLGTEMNGMLLESRLEPGAEALWLFASGTGVAPFLGLLNDPAACARYKRIYLVVSSRFTADSDYVKALMPSIPGLRLVRAVTREAGGELSCRIPAALEDGSLEAITEPITRETSRVMLCGNPALVKSIRDFMKTRNIVSPRGGRPGQLLAENFWF